MNNKTEELLDTFQGFFCFPDSQLPLLPPVTSAAFPFSRFLFSSSIDNQQRAAMSPLWRMSQMLHIPINR